MESTKELSGLSSWFKKLLSQFKKQQTQKTYIVPTKFGLVYGFICLALLLMAMAYGNNLVYIVCFYITVMGMGVAKWINTNVNSAKIESCYTSEIYAESENKITVQIRNTSSVKLHDLNLRIDKKTSGISFDLEPKEIRNIEIPWTSGKRGYTKIPTLRLDSQFPSGLFNAWKVKRNSAETIVYPALKGIKNYPDSAFATNESVGVLREIRDYKPGDSPKRIHWRSLAKNNQLRTLVHESNDGRSCYFEWSQVSHMPFEEALSQLTTWLHQAHTNHSAWNLKLPDESFSSSQNTQAYPQALRYLALWESKS